MRQRLTVFSAFGAALASPLGSSGGAEAQPTAIDIALKPDATMFQRALAANARLRETFPQGFAFDGTHHPHLTLVQRSWPPTTFQGERPARSFSARLFNRARHPLRPPQAGDRTRGARGIR